MILLKRYYKKGYTIFNRNSLLFILNMFQIIYISKIRQLYTLQAIYYKLLVVIFN